MGEKALRIRSDAGLLTYECALLKSFDVDLAQCIIALVEAVLIGQAVLTDTAALEEFYLVVLSVLRPDLIKTALGTKFLFK
ncbi:hypothetical protein Tco_0237284 [Tanacetum coccineum]